MLTALYDLDLSPLTFDFAYALAQGEAIRQTGGHDRIRFHIRTKTVVNEGPYSPGESDWRLRHVVAPLAQMVRQPAEIHVCNDPPPDTGVFTRPRGLHWMSDVLLLSEAGHEVRVFGAVEAAKKAMASRLAERVGGRRIVTITLRETHYAGSRNSNLAAWASLARRIPRDRYAVVVLRDHERANEPLPGNWGELVSVPEAIWSLHARAALYETGWLNLGVNNGPMVLLVLNPATRFVIFKMLGGTPETSAQHFLRLGVRPYCGLPFSGPEQHLVWENDDIDILEAVVMPILEDGTFPRQNPVPSVADCLIEAARRDYRHGQPAADTIARLPSGPLRTSLAAERIVMLLDESRPLDAVHSLAEVSAISERDRLAMSIAEAYPTREVLTLLEPMMKGRDVTEFAALSTAPFLASPLAARTARQSRPFKVTLEPGVDVASAMKLLGVAELFCRVSTEPYAIHVVAHTTNHELFSMIALFPSVSRFDLDGSVERTKTEWPEGAVYPVSDAGPSGAALVPRRAETLLDRWQKASGIDESGYIVVAVSEDADFKRIHASLTAEGLQSKIVGWQDLYGIWPIEMMAALLSGASINILSEEVAITLANLLGVSWLDPQELNAKTIKEQGRRLKRGVGLVERAAKVCCSPDLSTRRLAFANVAQHLAPAGANDMNPAERPEFSLVLKAFELVAKAGGRAARLAEPAASGLVLQIADMRQALIEAGAAAPKSLLSALSSPALHSGQFAALLRALCSGTRIDEPELLVLLDGVRHAVGRAAVSGEEVDCEDEDVLEWLRSLADQVWIRQGILAGPPDVTIRKALERSVNTTAFARVAQAMFPVVAENAI